MNRQDALLYKIRDNSDNLIKLVQEELIELGYQSVVDLWTTDSWVYQFTQQDINDSYNNGFLDGQADCDCDCECN